MDDFNEFKLVKVAREKITGNLFEFLLIFQHYVAEKYVTKYHTTLLQQHTTCEDVIS